MRIASALTVGNDKYVDGVLPVIAINSPSSKERVHSSHPKKKDCSFFNPFQGSNLAQKKREFISKFYIVRFHFFFVYE